MDGTEQFKVINPVMTIIINHAIRISEEDPNGKFKACVQRQNHKKYGQMTIANLRKLAVLTQQ